MTKESSKLKYIFYSTIITGSGQHPFDTCQWIVLRLSTIYTMWANFCLMVGQSRSSLLVQCQSIVYDAGSTPDSNTDRTHNSSTPASTAITGRLTNVASMMIQCVWQWPNKNPAFCILYFAAIAIGVTISSPVVTTQIHWPNCEIMLAHRLRRWANIIPTKTL